MIQSSSLFEGTIISGVEAGRGADTATGHAVLGTLAAALSCARCRGPGAQAQVVIVISWVLLGHRWRLLGGTRGWAHS